jgi:hypothetical protein
VAALFMFHLETGKIVNALSLRISYATSIEPVSVNGLDVIMPSLTAVQQHESIY